MLMGCADQPDFVIRECKLAFTAVYNPLRQWSFTWIYGLPTQIELQVEGYNCSKQHIITGMTLSLLPLGTDNISYTKKFINEDGIVPLPKKLKKK